MPLAVVIARCSRGVIAFIYSDLCVKSSLLDLIIRLCTDVEIVEAPADCILSGVKISREVPPSVPENCSYIEISLGLYVGLLPGFIDAQCIYCGEELSCRFALQKKACFDDGYQEIKEHLTLDKIAELVKEFLTVEDDILWCIDKYGRKHVVHLYYR